MNIDQLKIIHYPEPILREVARPIASITPEIRRVVKKMLELMKEAEGIGLAAPQVGLPWRMFVTRDIISPDKKQDLVFINPVLIEPSTQLADAEEGCLSLPELKADIRRPKQITIRAIGLDGKPFEMISDDLLARVWQHETDHLDGVLIIDRMPPADRLACKRLLRELEQSFEAKGA